jgi:hypothetical protein
MNKQSDTPNQRLKLITKSGSIHLGWVEDKQASTPTPAPIQLELDFSQATTDYH